MKFVCKFCESTEFNIVDGWYYCDECHRQNFQELEFDAFGMAGADGIMKKTKIRDTSLRNLKNVTDKTELTTWEAFNYILHGLVEELLVIGVKADVKLTVFQMWTHYLRKTEVAFFNKSQPALPKLPPIFTKRDADILYNHQRRARKRRRSVSIDRSSDTPSTNRARNRKITRLVDMSQRSEYQSELSDSKADINRTLTSLADVSVSEIRSVSGVSSATTNASSLAIEFSHYARSAFKKKVAKKHISKHSEDFSGDLKCHVVSYNDLGKDRFKILTRKTLFAIIYCALNHHKEPIEIGDLMRFCREGHLSFNCARKFIPTNLSEKEVDELNEKYTRSRKTEVNLHNGWRDFVYQTKEFLDVELEQPDLYALCQRYVEELCLPNTINDYVERMLVLCPSTVANEEHRVSFLPSYEAKAMSCILFVLKLLFGVDDATEAELSEATKNLNKHLEQHESKLKLFVWSEWVEYIEARRYLLEQWHAPSVVHASKQSTGHFLAHTQMKSYRPDENLSEEEVKDTPNRHTKSMLRSECMTQFAKYISEVDESRDPKASEGHLITFPPSLTPSKSYMEIIRDKYADKVTISPKLLVDHTCRDVKSFLDPVLLQKELLRTRTKLEIQEASINPQLRFVRWTSETKQNVFLTYIDTDFNISETKWKQKLNKRVQKYTESCLKDTSETHERRKAKFLRRKVIDRAQKTPKITDLDPNDLLFDPELYKDDSKLPETSDSQYDSIITMKLPHFYYWTHFYYSYGVITSSNLPLFEEISQNFPRSFVWLLNHCAKMIEISPNDLYSQLLIIENQFLYALKPMDRITTRLKYRSKPELPKKMYKRIEQFKNLW